MQEQTFMSGVSAVYFKFWLVEPRQAAESLKEALLKYRREMDAIDPRFTPEFRLLFYVDIDCEKTAEVPFPYEVGLTPQAHCFDVNLAEVESSFAAVDAACSSVSPHANQRLRIGIGKFATQEYDGIRTHSIYTKRMPLNMGSEWILFKNIYRRAGNFGWFWRRWAKWYDRRDN